jgi:hypothetical protein
MADVREDDNDDEVIEEMVRMREQIGLEQEKEMKRIQEMLEKRREHKLKQLAAKKKKLAQEKLAKEMAHLTDSISETPGMPSSLSAASAAVNNEKVLDESSSSDDDVGEDDLKKKKRKPGLADVTPSAMEMTSMSSSSSSFSPRAPNSHIASASVRAPINMLTEAIAADTTESVSSLTANPLFAGRLASARQLPPLSARVRTTSNLPPTLPSSARSVSVASARQISNTNHTDCSDLPEGAARCRIDLTGFNEIAIRQDFRSFAASLAGLRQPFL